MIGGSGGGGGWDSGDWVVGQSVVVGISLEREDGRAK